MDRVEVSAPGKVILMGEHAVVYGRPGLVAAIDRRLRVSIEHGQDGWVHFDLPAVGERRARSWDQVRRATGDARERWRRRFVDEVNGPAAVGVTPGELVALALGETADALGDDEPPGISVVVTSELPVGAGLGSSAALAVGVVGAYLAFRGEALAPAQIAGLALEVERRQHGLPSGVDHTAALRGGLLWVERGPHGLTSQTLRPRASAFDGLRVFHSGSPAQATGEMVAAVRARWRESPASVEASCDEIAGATRDFREALDSASLDRLLDAVRRAEAALEDLDVVPAAIRAVIRRIEAEGGAAKISGAGSLRGPGAGSVLVFHPEPERIAGWPFLDHWRPFPTTLPAEGLRRENQE